jgi:hypothetical protein
MYLLIDHNGRIVEEDGERLTFETEQDAQKCADDLDEPDWLIVKFVGFT